jgi:N6-L-threonylcarbamoyladenine synthase
MLSFKVVALKKVIQTAPFGLRFQCRRFTGNAIPIRDTGDWVVGRQGQLTTLAIETSCDDTSVAVLSIDAWEDRHGRKFNSEILFHERVTANSAQYGGIHPIVALDSHQQNLGDLVNRAIGSIRYRCGVDLIAVTRGPGLSRANLSVGLDLAKGLALAWDIPLVGVHHMQAHALTPRLCSIITTTKNGVKQRIEQGSGAFGWRREDVEPDFPFLTVLASGGHSTLLSSNSLTDHRILAETSDIAIGDCLDKAARAILPDWALGPPYGKALEDFAFDGRSGYNYIPPSRRQDELERRTTRWGWSIGPPLAESKGAEKSSRRMMYSFAGVLNTVERLMDGENGASRSIDERRELARETMRIVFEHLTSRILLYLHDLPPGHRDRFNTIVLSGGVAANTFLRHVLRSTLDARGFTHISLETPPLELCTDNALMVAWAGVEMYDAGYESDIGIQAIKKWSMDPGAEDGGILGPSGWVKKERPKDDHSRRLWHSLVGL